MPPRRQERARALCLRRLIIELHGLGVRRLCLEARKPVLNQRDVRTVVGARFLLPKGSQFRVEHGFRPGRTGAVGADLVAGALRAHRLGDPTCWEVPADRVHEIEVDTEC